MQRPLLAHALSALVLLAGAGTSDGAAAQIALGPADGSLMLVSRR
jgi:hypothetical protein